MTTYTSPSTTFQDEWSAFRAWVVERSRDAEKSGMWRRFIRDFDVHRSAAVPTDLRRFVFQEQRFRRYGFRERSQSTSIHARATFVHLCVRAAKALGHRLPRGVEETAGERALKQRGLWRGYSRFCAAMWPG